VNEDRKCEICGAAYSPIRKNQPACSLACGYRLLLDRSNENWAAIGRIALLREPQPTRERGFTQVELINRILILLGEHHELIEQRHLDAVVRATNLIVEEFDRKPEGAGAAVEWHTG
jgi:hypothetical protein